MERPPVIIGVGGGTASGKSLVCEKIVERLGHLSGNKQVIAIPLESFYKELNAEEQARATVGQYNFDHPQAFEFDALVSALETLQRGEPVTVPHYDFRLNRRNGFNTIQPAEVIIVEGILVFYEEKLRKMFNMKVFVDADADIRLARRVKRDTKERNRALEPVLQQYIKLVKPAFEDFCLPTKKYADLIIPRGGENDVAIDLLVQHVQEFLRTPRGSPELHANGDGDHSTRRVRAQPRPH